MKGGVIFCGVLLLLSPLCCSQEEGGEDVEDTFGYTTEHYGNSMVSVRIQSISSLFILLLTWTRSLSKINSTDNRIVRGWLINWTRNNKNNYVIIVWFIFVVKHSSSFVFICLQVRQSLKPISKNPNQERKLSELFSSLDAAWMQLVGVVSASTSLAVSYGVRPVFCTSVYLLYCWKPSPYVEIIELESLFVQIAEQKESDSKELFIPKEHLCHACLAIVWQVSSSVLKPLNFLQLSWWYSHLKENFFTPSWLKGIQRRWIFLDTQSSSKCNRHAYQRVTGVRSRWSVWC